MSQVSGDITKVEFGPCRVTFGGSDLGYFRGGVTFSYEVTWLDIKVDQHSAIIDTKVQQEAASVIVPIVQTAIDSLYAVFPTGTRVADSTKRKMEFGGKQVTKAGNAAQLILTPCTDGSGTIDTDSNNLITIHKAMARANYSKAYTIDDIRVIEVEFVALADDTKDAGNELFVLGDSTASA